MAKFILHKDKSATIFVSYNHDFLTLFKLKIPAWEREWCGGGKWLIHKRAERVLDLFEEFFPYGEFIQE
jgi:hypothetical protein